MPEREHDWRPPAEGLYDPALGKGFLRRRLHRQHQGQEVAPDRLRRAQHPVQSRASRRGRRRSARRRRRRHPGADPARLLRPQGGRARLHAAGARRLCGRRAVHAAGEGVAQSHPEHHRRPDQGRRTDAARLARRADRQFLARRDRQADRACQHAGVHRPRRAYQGSRTSSSAGSTSCASRFRRRSTSAATAASPAIIRRRCRAAPSIYKGMFLADQLGKYYPDLQRAGFRERAGAGASALLDQHLPDLVAGASVPDDRA